MGRAQPFAATVNAPAPALIWCPFADEASALPVVDRLLAEGLVACANILPPMRSLYIWQGKRGDERECAVLFKTNAALLDAAVARLDALHPYETPAAIGWVADASAPGAAEWLGGLRLT